MLTSLPSPSINVGPWRYKQIAWTQLLEAVMKVLNLDTFVESLTAVMEWCPETRRGACTPLYGTIMNSFCSRLTARKPWWRYEYFNFMNMPKRHMLLLQLGRWLCMETSSSRRELLTSDTHRDHSMSENCYAWTQLLGLPMATPIRGPRGWKLLRDSADPDRDSHFPDSWNWGGRREWSLVNI